VAARGAGDRRGVPRTLRGPCVPVAHARCMDAADGSANTGQHQLANINRNGTVVAMSCVPGTARSALLALAVMMLAGLTGCGGSSAQPVGAATPEPNSSPTSALAGIAPGPPAPARPASASGTPPRTATLPVLCVNR